MASTYVNNLRLEEMATGEQSGTWGTKTNTNLELVGQAFGWGTRAIANASTDNITIADGASDADRSMYLKLTGGGQACTITLLPNTSSKMWIMENATSYTLTFTQGSGANVAVPAGQTKMMFADGLGSGAVVYEVGTLALGGLQSNGTVTVGVDDTGYDVKFFGATSGKSFLWDESADSLIVTGSTSAQGTVTVGVDDTGYDVKFFGDTASRYWEWDTSADGVVQRGTLTVGVDDAGHDVKFFGDTASAYMEWDASADDLILGGAARLGVGTAPAANMVLDVSGQIKAGSTGTSLNTEPGGCGTFIQTTSSGQCAIMSYSSGGGTTLSLHSNSSTAAVVENIRMTPSLVTVNESSADMDFRVESNGNANMLFVDGGGDLVGIGTGSPATVLDVNGAATFSASNSGSDYIVRVKNTANASASDARLIIQNGGTSGGDALINLDGQATNATWSVGVDTSATKFVIADADKGGFDGSDEVFTIATGGNATFARDSTETGGQILISQAGTGDPNIQFSTAATSHMIGIDNSDSDSFKIDYGTTGTGAQTGYTLDTSGNSSVKRLFVEGVTNNTGGLFVGGTTVRNAAQISSDYTSAAQAGLAVNDTASGNGGAHISFLTGGTVRASITNNNNTAVAYNTSSDARLKENIRPILNAVERLKTLNPVKFDWIQSGLTSEGFIAQEVVDEQLAKDMVTGDPNGDVKENPMQIEYGRLTVLLTKALQESLEKIDMLETRIESLEGK